MSVTAITARVNAKLVEGREGLKKALDIKRKIIKLQKDSNDKQQKMSAAHFEKNKSLVTEITPLGKAADAGDKVALEKGKAIMKELKKIQLKLNDATDKLKRDTDMQVQTLTMELKMIRDKAMSALKLKSGVDIIKSEQKRKVVTEKVNKLTSMQNAKLLGVELEALKTRTKMFTKKM